MVVLAERAGSLATVAVVVAALAGQRARRAADDGLGLRAEHDLVLAPIASDGVSQALTGRDHSLTNAARIAIGVVSRGSSRRRARPRP